MNVCAKTGERLGGWLPPWRGLRRAALLVAACLALGPGLLPAQTANPTVAATLQNAVIDANESTQYQISVMNGRADNPPPSPVLAGLVFQFVTQETVGNYYYDSRTGSRMVNSVVYIYTVRAAHPGRYVIPGQEVMVGGVTMRARTSAPAAVTTRS